MIKRELRTVTRTRHKDCVRPATCDNFEFPFGWRALLRVVVDHPKIFVSLFYYRKLHNEIDRFLSLRWQLVILYLYGSGFIKKLFWYWPKDYEPAQYYFAIKFRLLREHTDAKEPGNLTLSRGFSTDYSEALTKVVGECVERVPFLYYKNSEFLHASVNDLSRRGKHFLDPKECITLSDEQYSLRANSEDVHTDDSPYRWVSVNKVGAHKSPDKAIWAPAQLFFWSYQRMKGEPFLREIGTHGLAAHTSRKKAITAGLCEIIERDGFFSFWLRGKSPPKIDLATIDDESIQQLIKRCQAKRLDVHLLNITTDDINIPNVFCVLESEDRELPSMVGGAGCDIDANQAIRSAILEATSMLHWLGFEDNQVIPKPAEEYPYETEYNDKERLNFWADHKNRERMNFFLTGTKCDFHKSFDIEKVVQKSDVTNKIIALLHNQSHDIYVLERNVKAMNILGLSAVSVLVPSLVPMTHDMRTAPLANKRLLLQIKEGREVINSLPHIFP